MGGGLVFTGMPRRREVLGTGIIRWTKVTNPEGTVTWQECRSGAPSNTKKDEKDAKTEKKVLERPSWIQPKKESEARGHKRRATVAEDSEHKDKRVETRTTRAFSFQAKEEKIERIEKVTNVVKVRSETGPSYSDQKKGSVAGLASKFGGTVEVVIPEKKEVNSPRNASFEVPKTSPRIEKQPTRTATPPSPPKEEINTFDNAFRSHWSVQEEPKQQETDAELAARLANTERIFRQQEQKIQAALDRIKDLERQLALGFTTGTTEDDVQSKASWDNSSIAAGGQESGPLFRQIPGCRNANTKGPLPFSHDDDDSHYRVLTVNSNKPEVCEGTYHEVGTCEVDGDRTPSPIAVNSHINLPERTPEQGTTTHQLPTAQPKFANIDIPKTRPTTLKSQPTSTLKSHPPLISMSLTRNNSTKLNTQATAGQATRHKPLPLLPIDNRLKPSSATGSGPKLSPPLHFHFPPTLGARPSLCIGSGRPKPPRSVSGFKKLQRVRPLTPIPEEPCSLKRRSRVPRRRSRSSLRRVSTVSTGGGGVWGWEVRVWEGYEELEGC